MAICKFCGKSCKNDNSLRTHERLCKLNPNRQRSPFEDKEIQARKKKSNQYLKAKDYGLPKPILSKETLAKLSNAAKNRKMPDDQKKKLSILAKNRGLGGHTSKQKIYFKKNNGDIIYLQSSYEIKFATILEELNIEWERPEPLNWVDSYGVDHRYYPDFKIGKKYFDTKNSYLAVKDKDKIERVSTQNNVSIDIVTIDKITKEYIINAL